jgi:hypothetical protein
MTQKALLESAGDGTAIQAGYVGEVISGVQTGTTISVAANTWTDITNCSITLTPGLWDLSAYVHANNAAPTGFVYWAAGVTTTSGNNAPTSYGDRVSYTTSAPNSTIGNTQTISTTRVNLSSNTTFYLKAYVPPGTSGFSVWAGTIRATRIA